MARITLIAGAGDPLAKALLDLLQQVGYNNEFSVVECDHIVPSAGSATYVYIPKLTGRDEMIPDLRRAEEVFRATAQPACSRFALISSALVYGIGFGRQVLVDETYVARGSGRISEAWQCLETQASRHFSSQVLVILRPSLLLSSAMLPARILRRRRAAVLPGHDPALQVLSVSDLASAVLCALKSNASGTYNVSPDAAVPLKRALVLAGVTRVPIPRTVQRLVSQSESLDYIRYPWTVSNHKIKRELGFIPEKSSLAAAMEFHHRSDRLPHPEPSFDPFGSDPEYLRRLGKFVFRFLSDYYWRIEDQGMEHVPRTGRAVLVGMHRGFVPLDGAMAVYRIARETGRIPRFLTHPMLFKFPFLFDFMTKMGGVPACQESAARVLEDDGLLGVFPEGVQGAFTLYRNAYKLQRFGRDTFVKMALRYRAPIIPFVTLGSAEIFPVFAAIRLPWFKRYAGFPYIPITPTFPLLPLPLPSKWHTRFLNPIDVTKFAADAAEDPSVVKAISLEVRKQMQGAIDEMRSRRRSIFFGSIFKTRSKGRRSKPAAV